MNAEALVSKVTDLRPPAPSVVRLLGLLNRPDADSDAVIRVVEMDGVLSAKVLSLCNSAWFGCASPVGSISQALLRLGFAQLHRIVMAVGFGSMMNTPLTGYAIEDHELWQHSLLTALLARKIIESAEGFPGDASIVFTAALVHDIGKLVLNTTLDPCKQAAVQALIATGEHRLSAERNVIGCDHAEVGAALLTRWNLPENIVEAVAHHHAPPLQPAPALSAIVHLANGIAHEAGSAPGWDSFAIPMVSEVPEALGLAPRDLDVLVMTAFDLLQSEPELASPHEPTP
ncbi:MAG: HDOD domain-containing protein [Chthoniobacteraceae bacterium]